MTSLIMPVAGMGSRFSAAGYRVPKPMIPLDKRTFVEWAWLSAARSMNLGKTVFVARAEHLNMGMDSALLHAQPDCSIILSSQPGCGAAADAALGLGEISPDEPVAINDCDHAFVTSARLDEFTQGVDAITVIGFPSQNPAHGFGLLSGRGNGDLSGIVEKRIVGPLAIGGCYLFSSARLLANLVQAAQPAVGEGEFYVSRLVNEGIKQGVRARMQPVKTYLPFGTPAELNRLVHGQVARMLSS